MSDEELASLDLENKISKMTDRELLEAIYKNITKKR